MPYLGNAPAEAYSQISYQDLTGGSGTSFTLDYPAGSAGEIEVFVNNVRQEPTVAYTVSGTSLTMTGSISATDDFYVVFQGKAQQTIGIPEKQTDGTYLFPNTVDVNDTIRFDTGDTTVSTDDVFGDIEFYDNDGGSAGAGVTAKIQATAASTYGASQLIFSTSSSSGGARTSLTERLRILSSGGITFNGDTAAANALDDYEEGTWTPVVQGNTTSGTTTYASGGQYGYYTKIGNCVHIVTRVEYTALTGTGNFVLEGLPFTPTSSSQNLSPMSVIPSAINWTAGTSFIGLQLSGTSKIQFYGISDDGSATAQQCVNEAGNFRLSGFYFTNA